MNLFNIDQKYYSHPNYALQKHISNIAASFEDGSHKEAAFFHDIGKLSNEFQTYIRDTLHTRRTTHSLESAFIYLVNKNYKITAESFAIFYAIMRHHGNLEDTNKFLYDNLSLADDLPKQYFSIKERLSEICDRAGLKLNPDIEEICNFFYQENFVQEYNFVSYRNYFFIKEIFSKLIFADKYEAIFKASYTEKKSNKWGEYIANLIEFIKAKSNKMSSVRNQAREEIIQNYDKNQDKKIYIIEAPTGIGKTFSALHLALKICQDKHKKRIINVLPMTSIIDQTYEEYGNIIDESELLKFHYLTNSKDYVSHDNGIESVAGQRNDFLSMSWSSDKVIITTLNQLLNAFYSNKNRDLIKFWTLRDSVIILDEIQAVPRILIQDVSETITCLSKNFNIDFILMSATIPAIKQFIPQNIRAELLDNRYYSMSFNNRYSIAINTQINDIESFIAAAKNYYKNKKSLLCVVNSKKLSLNIYTELQKYLEETNSSSELFFLNTNIIPKHRSQIIAILKKRLQEEQKTLLVSTQVIDTGVDLDFDFGLREFAPFYSSIQTAGRINRENRKGFNKTAKLIITDKIGYCPYHPTDLLKEKILVLLSSEINENKMLPYLKKYFDLVMKRVTPDPLLSQNIKMLNFKTVYRIYQNNFMKTIPNITPVFIEIEKNLYQSFLLKIDELYKEMNQPEKSIENVMKCRSRLKSILKKISQYVINVAQKETLDLQDFHQIVKMKVCPYKFVKNGVKYSMKKGWVGEKTLTINF